MASVAMYNMKGDQVGTMELSDGIFGVDVNENLVHEAVVCHLANMRQGTQKAKTRSEVRGGGKKPWRQKGTGHARQGSTRSPQWKGGGVVFAPTPRDYSMHMNKKARRLALKSALTSRVEEGRLIVLDELSFENIKTKDFASVMKNFDLKKALVVLANSDRNIILSARNLPGFKTTPAGIINTYDIMKYETVVATKAAVEQIEEVFA